MAVDVAALSDHFVESYGPVVTDSLTKRGEGDHNAFLTPASILSRLKDVGRVYIAGQAGDRGGGTQYAYSNKHKVTTGQSGGSFGEGDSYPASGSPTLENVQQDWKNVWEPIEASGLAQDTAQGSAFHSDMDIWSELFEDALYDIFDNIEDQLLLDGTGNSGKDLDGVKSFLKQTGSYAGIDMTTNAWWRPYLKDASSAALSLALLRDVKYTLHTRKSKWTAVWTSEKQKDAYVDLIGSNVRYTSIQMADIEMEVPVFEGRPVIPIQGWDDDMMAFVDENLLAVRVLPPSSSSLRNHSEPSDFKGMPLRLRRQYPDRDADALSIIFRGNFTNYNPYKTAYLDNLAV